MSFGLVLGAGGTVGAAFHRGAVRAMTDLGFDPRQAEVVVGTSAGSIVAASLRRRPGRGPGAAGAEPTGGVAGDRAAADSTEATPAVDSPVQVRRLVPRRAAALQLWRRPRQALNAALLWPEFAVGRTSIEFLRDELPTQYRRWPDAALYIVAVRRSDGRRVVFGRSGEPRTDVGAAVAASCAIPGYFAPITIDGVDYVDGGLHSPTNADVLADASLDLVIVSSPLSVQLRSVCRRVDLPLRLMFHGYLREEIWVLRQRQTRVVTIEPDAAVLRASGLNMMDGRTVHEVEERAYELGRHRLRDVPMAPTAKRP